MSPPKAIVAFVLLLLCTVLLAAAGRPARAEAQLGPIPQTIRVRITGKPEVCDLTAPYTVRVIPFQDYVAAVLPAEWEGGWPMEAYRAGAVAIKMYAWYWIERGGKWPDADVYDSVCDQVYDPRKVRPATTQAVQETWNWLLTRNGQLFEARHKQSDRFGCSAPFCMEQLLSRDLARAGYSWDEILQAAYGEVELTALELPPGGFALDFDGTNRLEIPLDPLLSQDVTIEWWQKATVTGRDTARSECHPNWDWQTAPQLLAGGSFGVAVSGDRPAFGVQSASGHKLTLCGQVRLSDGQWHHLVIQRRAADGALWLFVDGRLQDSTPAFREELAPAEALIVGQGLHGWVDELRISSELRYGENFTPPQSVFQPDAATLALYHFDEGFGNPRGSLRLPGGAGGPFWRRSTLFVVTRSLYIPLIWSYGP